MNASIYNLLMIVSFALSGVFLAVAIFLFFKLKIKSVADELSGKKSRRQVEEIRKENTGSQSRGYVPGIFKNRNDRTTTSLSGESGKLNKRATSKLSAEEKSRKLDEVLDADGGTVVLSESMQDAGYDEGTSVLGASFDDEGTTLLASDDEGTTLLREETNQNTHNKLCTVIREITVMESADYLRIKDVLKT